MKMRAFGRKHAPDERDRQFLLSKIETGVRPAKKSWRLPWHGDQGKTSMCVGFAWHARLRSMPVYQKEPSPQIVYAIAQRNDEWPGENYDGTSVRGGAKALQMAGKVKSYGWALSAEEAIQWVGTQGPVVLGTNWYSGMMKPNKNGLVTISGNLVGGHAYLLLGYNDTTKLAMLQNSWGTDWGQRGRFFLSYADLDRLIKEEGEACAPTE